LPGTPRQKFDVVADTGSDAIIVPSCTCVNAGYCSNSSRCFQGTNRSKTFGMTTGPSGPTSIRMMFGSGPVQAVVASDTVRVGKLHTKMDDGLLLMTDQLLNIKGPFEGILGLGLPGAEAKKNLYSQSSGGAAKQQPPVSEQFAVGSSTSDITAAIRKAVESGGLSSPIGNSDGLSSPIGSNDASVGSVVVSVEDLEKNTALLQTDENMGAKMRNATQKKKNTKAPKKELIEEENLKQDNDTGIVVKGFMEESGIKRFSMCFNDGKNGVLRLGTPKVKGSHGSVGQVHWGLDFRGISVGGGNKSEPVSVGICSDKNMTKGQSTPCGAIPDSGTTALMAPAEHLITLYETLCDQWDRCKKNFTAMTLAADQAKKSAIKAYHVDPFHIQADPKAVIFQHLILDCKEWLTDDEGLDELPPIHFHVAGANGTRQDLQLTGWSYIIETHEKEFKYVYQNIPGLGKLPVGKNFTGKTNKVCSPAFSPMEYKTEQNGPVWIMGTPIFYEYQVGYDMETKPPAISFSNVPCGSCGGEKTEKASFISHSVRTKGGHARQPRQVNGPFRMPNMDLKLPL